MDAGPKPEVRLRSQKTSASSIPGCGGFLSAAGSNAGEAYQGLEFPAGMESPGAPAAGSQTATPTCESAHP